MQQVAVNNSSGYGGSPILKFIMSGKYREAKGCVNALFNSGVQKPVINGIITLGIKKRYALLEKSANVLVYASEAAKEIKNLLSNLEDGVVSYGDSLLKMQEIESIYKTNGS